MLDIFGFCKYIFIFISLTFHGCLVLCMQTRSKSNKEQLQYILEMEAFARKLSSSSWQSNTPREEVDSSFLALFSDLEGIEMEKNNGNNYGNNGSTNHKNPPPNPPSQRELLCDYVQPQGPRNLATIVLSPEPQALDIKLYWFTYVQFTNSRGKHMKMLINSSTPSMDWWGPFRLIKIS
jgi:hypothetical protein